MKPDVYLLSTKIANAMAASNPPLSNQSLFIYLDFICLVLLLLEAVYETKATTQ
jgi:hypothetical protein